MGHTGRERADLAVEGGGGAQQRTLTSPIRPHNCYPLSRLNRKRNTRERAFSRFRNRLQQTPPARACRREKFLERRYGDIVTGHLCGYIRTPRGNPVPSLLSD